MNIAIIVPCYNEEQNVKSLHQRLISTMNQYGQKYEIIFVDDGSKDNTWGALEQIKYNNGDNIKIIKLLRNYGKDAALNVAFKNSSAEIIVTIDGDLQNFPEDIPLLLDRLKQCDAVIGWRKNRHDNLPKIISSYLANLIRNKVLRENLHDAGCGLRAFKKKCLSEVGSYKLLDTFLFSIFKKIDYKVDEVIVRHEFRKFGKSKFNLRNRLFYSAFALMVVWWLNRNMLVHIEVERCIE